MGARDRERLQVGQGVSSLRHSQDVGEGFDGSVLETGSPLKESGGEFWEVVGKAVQQGLGRHEACEV